MLSKIVKYLKDELNRIKFKNNVDFIYENIDEDRFAELLTNLNGGIPIYPKFDIVGNKRIFELQLIDDDFEYPEEKTLIFEADIDIPLNEFYNKIIETLYN